MKDRTPPPVTVKVRIPEEADALAVGKNGYTKLRGLGFWLRHDDVVGIDLYGSRNMPLDAGAYSIPKDLMNQLCKDWLEAQGYSVYDRPPDHCEYVFEDDGLRQERVEDVDLDDPSAVRLAMMDGGYTRLTSIQIFYEVEMDVKQ